METSMPFFSIRGSGHGNIRGILSFLFKASPLIRKLSLNPVLSTSRPKLHFDMRWRNVSRSISQRCQAFDSFYSYPFSPCIMYFPNSLKWEVPVCGIEIFTGKEGTCSKKVGDL
ncbi:UNVERIFIED_CONTAM: hypothetical protein NCL1_05099 [Trichonephila clavipes]